MHKLKTEIIVVGGGIAGTVAAIAAARQGMSTVLVEKQYALGGIATNGMMCNMFGTHFKGEPFLGGIANEIADRLIEAGQGELFVNTPLSSGPNVFVDRVDYNPEYLKILLDQLAKEAGVEVKLGFEVTEIQCSDNQKTAHLTSSGASHVVEWEYLIDATGNSNCFKLMGFPVKQDEKKQPATLMFKLSDIDKTKLKQVSSKDIQETIKLGMAEGVLPAKVLGIAKIPNSSQVGINVTRQVDVDQNDSESLSDAMQIMRAQIDTIVPFLKNHVLGFENAVISGVASMVGIRDADRIHGRYEIKDQDLVKGEKFEDGIASCCYPVDIHVAENGGSILMNIGGDGYYTIPYRSLISDNAPWMIAAGRCISSERAAFASLRIIGTSMALGEASGIAAAVAFKSRSTFLSLSVSALQNELTSQALRIK